MDTPAHTRACAQTPTRADTHVCAYTEYIEEHTQPYAKAVTQNTHSTHTAQLHTQHNTCMQRMSSRIRTHTDIHIPHMDTQLRTRKQGTHTHTHTHMRIMSLLLRHSRRWSRA